MTHKEEGYKVIALKHRSDRQSWHQMFIKEHTKTRSATDLPVGKTLFVVNVPPYVNAEHLTKGFAIAGEVAHVVLADRKGNRFALPSTLNASSRHFTSVANTNVFKCAFIVFRSTKALRNALDLDEVQLYQNDKTILTTGISKWQQEHAQSMPDDAAIELEVQQYIATFEQSELEQRVAAKQPEVDDDGWQVVKKGRGSGLEQKETTLKRLDDKVQEGKSKKELQNFYTFQIRDSKRQHVVGLRKRFENDKRKIETMKQARHFKPY